MKRNFGTRLNGAVVIILAICVAALFCASSRLWAQSGAAQSAFADKPAASPSQATPETKAKTSAEAYKNIQVLKEIRADQLIPSMRYITAALGVRCDFCHVQDHFESDDKPEKGRAREMMKMMMAINADNFRNRREVTCYTCHAGHSHPMSIPAIPPAPEVASANAAPNSQPPGGTGENHEAAAGNASAGSSAPMPTVDEILAKYTQALGGAGALQQITSCSEKGTVDIPARNIHATMDVLRKAPDKALATLHTPAGDIVEGFDGTTGWESRGNRGAREETGDELVRVHEWAAFIPGLDLKTQYSRPMVAGIEQINGHDAYRVFAFRKGGSRERLYFDTQSGLLVQLDTLIDSPLGSLPEQSEFEDYRDVSGVKIPFTIRVSRLDGTTIYKWDHVEANVAIDDTRFAMHAAAPAPAKP